MKRLTKIALAATLFAASVGASAANVLVVLSDVSQLELKDGKTMPTGFYLNELMQPVKLLLDAGHTLTYVTPLGKAPTMDKGSADKMFFNNDEASLAAHLALLDKLKLTAKEGSPVISLAKVEKIGYGKFDAIYVPGGHAPMQDLLKSKPLGKLLTSFHEKGKVTALVCHGPIALLSAMPDAPAFAASMEKGSATANPKWIYAGYQMTAFSDKEEEASKAQLNGGEMKFYPQAALQKAGGAYSAASELWGAKVVIDRELITGQNPASAVGVGQAMLQRLK